ncbi:MAG: hypothetical protein PHO37_00105 [Kiritimatiellae bacterium]|nr:hypothetical protein [Kiritimatiellia bacterium]
MNVILICICFGALTIAGFAAGDPAPGMTMPQGAKLVFEEDWSTGRIDSDKWYALHKRWGEGNHGVVSQNVFIAQDIVGSVTKNVLVCRGHGDRYAGSVTGWKGNVQRVGGVIVSKSFFASGRYEVVMKIGSESTNPDGPEDPKRPIGMVPAIWTYAYRWVGAGNSDPEDFNQSNPLYNPYVKNEYWSEIDFPEFGKGQELESGLYNTFLNRNHQSLQFCTKSAIDGKYHVFTSIWRTHLVALDGVTDSQVTMSGGFWWVQDKAISFSKYCGNPLKRLGKDQYAVYMGKEVTHFIDGRFVGKNLTHVPAMAAQLNIGVWFPRWGGLAPWAESTISVASVKVWQFYDPGDVRGVLTDDIPANMDKSGNPLSR